MKSITVNINGRTATGSVEPRTHLADFLREQQLLTGTHIGCEHGICGACTVLIDGEIARSCITYAVQCDGANVTTIEGLDDDPLMTRLRAAFTGEHALQCGYCTPGMLISARDLVRRVGDADEQQVRIAMSGNLCRCTGYMGIVAAVRRVMTEQPTPEPRQDTPRGPGPAPGPDAPRTEQSASVASAPRTLAPAAEASDTPSALTPPEDIADEGLTRIKQSFEVPFPPARVWEFLGDLRAVAGCLPGASVNRVEGDLFSGEMRVKLGPVSSAFVAQGSISADAPAHSARVIAHGNDARSGSRVKGRIDYQVQANESGGSRVAIDVGYSLSGMLAQFGRSGIVTSLASRLTDEFARNMAARLAGTHDEREQASDTALDAGGLFWSVLWSRLRAMLGLDKQR